MKTPYLTEEKIRQAVAFLKARRDHAVVTKNKDWKKEYDNVLTVLKELSTLDF